jgi:hypothetical protein
MSGNYLPIFISSNKEYLALSLELAISGSVETHPERLIRVIKIKLTDDISNDLSDFILFHLPCSYL